MASHSLPTCHSPPARYNLPKRQRTTPHLPLKRKRLKQANTPADNDKLNKDTSTRTLDHKTNHASHSHKVMPPPPETDSSRPPSDDDLNPYVLSRVVENITQHILIRRKQRFEATLNNRIFTHLNNLSHTKNPRSNSRPSPSPSPSSRPGVRPNSHHSQAPPASALADLNYYLDGPPTVAKHSASRSSPTPSPSSSQNVSHSRNITTSEASTNPAHPQPPSPSSSPCPRPENVSTPSPHSSTDLDKDNRSIPRKRPRLNTHNSHSTEPLTCVKSLPPKRSRISTRTCSPSASNRSTKSRFSNRPRSTSPAALKTRIRSNTKSSDKHTPAPTTQLAARVESAPKAKAVSLNQHTQPSQFSPVAPEHSAESCNGDVFTPVSHPSDDEKIETDDDTDFANIPEEETDHTCTSARTAGYSRKDWQRNGPQDLSSYHHQHGHVTFSSRDNRLQHRKFRNSISQIDPNHNFLNADLLKQRKRDVQFRKSFIHGMGLFACEAIDAGEFVLEYIGEIIRGQVANLREERYTRRGMGDSYLFRLSNDLVVDATQRGCIARFINHSCDPNLVAKIILVRGQNRIVFYSKRPIKADEELTYDYKFDYEDDDKKIDCLCGASTCRRFLN